MNYFTNSIIDNISATKAKMAKSLIADKDILAPVTSYIEAEAAFAKSVMKIATEFCDNFKVV